jgi:hypothetical protein
MLNFARTSTTILAAAHKINPPAAFTEGGGGAQKGVNMKKPLFLLMAIILLLSLVSCASSLRLLETTKTETTYPTGNAITVLNINTDPTTAVTSTDGRKKPLPFEVKRYITVGFPTLPVSAKLAKLTKEDGTGIISLDTPPAEVRAILRRENITFVVKARGSIFADDEIPMDESIDCVIFEDGANWIFNEGSGWTIHTVQTQKGLKFGDPISKALELYGEPMYKDSVGRRSLHYRFNDENDFFVSADGSEEDSAINYIMIAKIPSWALEGGGA